MHLLFKSNKKYITDWFNFDCLASQKLSNTYIKISPVKGFALYDTKWIFCRSPAKVQKFILPVTDFFMLDVRVRVWVRI